MLIFKLMNMGSLANILQKQKGKDFLPRRMVKTIARSVLKGLCYLHSKGIIHRDLKPGNILLHREDNNSLDVKISGISFPSPFPLLSPLSSSPLLFKVNLIHSFIFFLPPQQHSTSSTQYSIQILESLLLQMIPLLQRGKEHLNVTLSHPYY